jgi:hypothetical protein
MLEFRPHHFLCTLGFEGKGYSDAFVANYLKIARSLRQSADGDDTAIRVVKGSDSICTPCPNRAGERCTTEGKISKLDQAHAEVLGLKTGDILTWGEAKGLLREKMGFDDFHQACAPCSWRSLGLCETALRRLKESDDVQASTPGTSSDDSSASGS